MNEAGTDRGKGFLEGGKERGKKTRHLDCPGIHERPETEERGGHTPRGKKGSFTPGHWGAVPRPRRKKKKDRLNVRRKRKKKEEKMGETRIGPRIATEGKEIWPSTPQKKKKGDHR